MSNLKVLFLHGLESRPGGTKPSYLQKLGYEVLNPALPKSSWEESQRIAQEFIDNEKPRVIVGSSRGGALAMSLDYKNIPLVLISPAWERFNINPQIPKSSMVLAPEEDKIVSTSLSKKLAEDNECTFIQCGKDHRMSSIDALEAIADAVKWVLK
jgi:predicted esterase YcpF (UPF0227 family)